MAIMKGREMGRDGCVALLRETGWGVLASVELDHTSPYAVPVAYAFDGEVVWVAMNAGRKLRALEKHSSLCLTVTDVQRMDRWRSVVVEGEARWVPDILARAAAARAYSAQRFPGGHEWSLADASKLLTAAICRLDIRAMSGRCQGW